MFSNDELRGFIRGEILGDVFPYHTNDHQEVEKHLERLFYRIKRIHGVECEADFDHYGSGYASFVEFFCHRKTDTKVLWTNNGIQEKETIGIIVNISRLAPVAIMGEDTRSQRVRVETGEWLSGGNGLLIGDPRALQVSEDLKELARAIKLALHEYDIELLTKDQLDSPLPFKAEIPTILQEPSNYLVMDAIFYWED
ncbi:hypothetical protein JCM19045_3490 [Bacillus sp. JCM 19045]|nr:hypothetical protein JCM19045_3490 [Bacillus sp. JCM 19045]